ncbi:MAG: N-6 DNA methylase, partial [Gammaproteobacteria bacterium]|nr:N-6 DNA methylase [Gammaproteobacteria bacterium]
HYTDRDKIMLIVEPVVIRPWLAEWEREKTEIAADLARAETAKSPATRSRRRNKAEFRFREFLNRLRGFTVLDPACGSGNFLYLALQALKGLEHRVQLEAEVLGFQRAFPEIGPANVKGIEINPYAAELARVSVWIGEIQWMRRNGFAASQDPILKPLNTIECRDAILAPDGSEPEWPEADVVIGNPPFLGARVMRGGLGHDYTERLRRTYRGVVASSADLVCYWFHKAGGLVAQGKLARGGLVATNSIRGGDNRPVLDRIATDCVIFDAWPDEPWVIDGAAVRVSLMCFGARDAGLPITLNGEATTHIHADLTDDTINLTQAVRLATNQARAFLGVNKNGAFDIPGHLAREWLQLPANPNGRPNADVLRPRIVGKDLVQRSSDQWIIEFGATMSKADSALYEAPFAYVAEHVRPVRATNRVKPLRENWWRHMRPRPVMWQALEGMARCIVTPTLAKHRLFAWLDTSVCPDHQLIVIARNDDVTFGILHSRFHEAWSLRLGTWLGVGNDPRYTPTTTFETFPFPGGLSPDIPAVNYAEDRRAVAIARAARQLVELRDRWLNPPEWVEWVDEPVPGYPKRPVARDTAAAKELKARTLTSLYNARPQWLAAAHSALDAAVAAGSGWGGGVSGRSCP